MKGSVIHKIRRAGRMRLDRLLAERGLAASREQAQRLIMAGRVRVDGLRVDKAGAPVRGDAEVTVATPPRYVGRGGEKLEAAIEAFGVRPAGKVCLDVGASTGGFTHCLLLHGARLVYAVDVGHGQLHPALRTDPRVVVLEGVNARALAPPLFPEPPELATVDVAFISLEKVLPAVAGCLTPRGEVLALAKPQFEVGRGRVGKGGVVRDPARHREVLERLAAFVVAHGLSVRGVAASPLKGPKGNREFFLHLVAGGGPSIAVSPAIERLLELGGLPG